MTTSRRAVKCPAFRLYSSRCRRNNMSGNTLVFTDKHWDDLFGLGYTIVSGAIDPARLRAAQDAANHLNAVHPDEGWERSRNESWREIRYCRHPAFMAVATDVLDPLALEILDSAPPPDFVQFAVTMPGFATKVGVGRNFHLD